MQETLGIIFIAMAAVLMVIVGVYGLAPMILPRWTRDAIDTVDLAGSQEDLLEAVSKPAIDKGMIEELFAELYSVRMALAEITSKNHEGSEGQTEALNGAGSNGDAWGGLDQGTVDELFAELFSIRTAVATMSGELRTLRETIQANEPKRRRPTSKAA